MVDLRGLEPRWLSPCKGNPKPVVRWSDDAPLSTMTQSLRGVSALHTQVQLAFDGFTRTRTWIAQLKRLVSSPLSYEPALVRRLGIQPSEPEGSRVTAGVACIAS
jgi:hypothetical protein